MANTGRSRCQGLEDAASLLTSLPLASKTCLLFTQGLLKPVSSWCKHRSCLPRVSWTSVHPTYYHHANIPRVLFLSSNSLDDDDKLSFLVDKVLFHSLKFREHHRLTAVTRGCLPLPLPPAFIHLFISLV